MLLLARRKESDRSSRQNERVGIRFQALFDCDRDSPLDCFAPVDLARFDAVPHPALVFVF
jgi:hypothetical protein